MNQESRAKRHAELWLENNNRVRRGVLASLVFAAFVFLQILAPYQGSLAGRIAVQEELGKKGSELETKNESLKQLDMLQPLLRSSVDAIQDEPWTDDLSSLRKQILDLNSTGRGSIEVFRPLANDTIEKIAQEAHGTIKPLATFLDENASLEKDMPDLFRELREVPKAIIAWAKSYEDVVWYNSWLRKEATAMKLGEELDAIFASVARAINQEQNRIEIQRREINDDVDGLKKLIAAQEVEEEKLETRMQTILPEWIKGLISVEQMIQIYPLIIMGLALYVFIGGATLRVHYKTATQDWPQSDQIDPAFSSLWTLVYRGQLGTALTVATYSAVIFAFWVFFSEGAGVFAEWNTAELAGHLDTGEPVLPPHWLNSSVRQASNLLATRSNPAYWLARGILAAAILVAIYWPLSDALKVNREPSQ